MIRIRIGIFVLLFLIFNFEDKLKALELGAIDIFIDSSGYYDIGEKEDRYNLDGSLNYNYSMGYLTSLVFKVSYIHNGSLDNKDYNNINLAYIGIEDLRRGNLYLGNTPSVLYQGFVSGWLDYGMTGGNEIIESDKYGDFLGLKNPNNSIYYLYRKRNFKIALQAAGASDNKYYDSSIGGDREYLYSLGIAYAYASITFGISYLEGKYERNNIYTTSNQDFSKTSIMNAGIQAILGNIYSAFGIFYDNNRWDLGNESLSYNFIINYDDAGKNRKLVPQIIYGYRKYLKEGDLTSSQRSYVQDNYIYLTLMYYVNKNLNIFYETKYSFLEANNKENKNFVGLKYIFIN